MKKEIQIGIKDALEGDAGLTTTLGTAGAARIMQGWPSAENAITAADPVLLCWGPDVIGSAQSEDGNAATKRVPDFDVPFHLFGVSPEKIADAADALDTLWGEKLDFITTNYRVLRITLVGDIGPYEDERDWYHRVITYGFRQIWAN